MPRKPAHLHAAALAGLICLSSFSPTAIAPLAPTTRAALPKEAGFARPSPQGLPKLEALEFMPIGQDEARLINAGIATDALGPIAKPFAISGDVESRARAVDCLASAMWYEAGNDRRGQRSVGQVVLNRVRHPSFPATVCGVVFQGSERKTGCQFTFTCDGALARRPDERAFAEARGLAFSLLTGETDHEVGLATHYHTDWVHPLWSAQLAKIAQVHTHLFFRWAGHWGGPRAMVQRYAGEEPVIPALAALSPVHRPAPSPDPNMIAAQAQPAREASRFAEAFSPATFTERPGVFTLPMSPSEGGGSQALTALDLCGDRDFCKVIGRVAGSRPDDVAFLFVRDRRTGVERALWDCRSFPRRLEAQCLSPENRKWIDFDGNLRTGWRNADT